MWWKANTSVVRREKKMALGGEVDALVFPLLAQGHIIPFMQLCESLAFHGLNVVFLTTPSNAQRLCSRADKAGIAMHEIPGPHFPGLPDGADSADKVPLPLLQQFVQATEMMEPSFREIVARLCPRCIINDFKPLFVPTVAAEMGTPVFTLVSGVYNVDLLLAVARCVPIDSLPFPVPAFAKSVVLRDCDLLRPFRCAKKTDPFVQFFLQVHENLKKCNGVIDNTVYELEPEFVDHFQKVLGVPVWTVGPMLPPGYARSTDVLSSSNSCMTWLSTQNPGSVLYVCFGSEAVLEQDQLQELALGLESSGHPFLWAIKKPHYADDDVSSLLPAGFVERMKSRASIVMGWAPQQAILCHPSTGGFLSHCGWNSVMESISQGVPMLTCPFQLDQPFAAKFVVEEVKMGAEVKRQERNGVFAIERGEVQKAVKLLMEGEEGKEMRRRGGHYKQIVSRALAENGSSALNLLKNC